MQGGTEIWKGELQPSNKNETDAYGTARIRLIPAEELGNYAQDRGAYLHGKQAGGIVATLGCLCDKGQVIQNYFLYDKIGKQFRGKVYLQVK